MSSSSDDELDMLEKNLSGVLNYICEEDESVTESSSEHESSQSQDSLPNTTVSNDHNKYWEKLEIWAGQNVSSMENILFKSPNELRLNSLQNEEEWLEFIEKESSNADDDDSINLIGGALQENLTDSSNDENMQENSTDSSNDENMQENSTDSSNDENMQENSQNSSNDENTHQEQQNIDHSPTNDEENLQNDDETENEMYINKIYSFLKGRYERYEIRFKRKYKSLDELFDFLENSGLSEILNKVQYPNPNSYISFRFEINTMKLLENGEVSYSKIAVKSSHDRLLTKDQILRIYRERAEKCIEKGEIEGSGWSIKDIEEIIVSVAKDHHTLKKYGSSSKMYKYPVKCPGLFDIINIDTESDCVQLHMIAHFEHLENKSASKKAKSHRHYRNKIGKYFTFPENIESFVKLEDFNKIEKATNTNIILYKLSHSKNNFQLSLLRKGGNKDVEPSRYIHLCQLLDEDHVFLITNIQHYINLVKYGRFNRLNREKSICRFCMAKICKKKITKHEEICTTFKSTATVEMPSPNQEYKFSAYNATLFSKYICIYDTETYFEKSSDNANGEHKLLAYSYIILSRENDIVKKKISVKETNQSSDQLSIEMVSSIEKDFSELYDEYKKSFNRKPLLTVEEEQKHQDCTACEICNKKFGEKLIKHRHHCWDVEVEMEGSRVVKGNYLATLCPNCNMRISLKYSTFAVVAHNGGRFDSKFVLDGYERKKFTGIDITPKSGENFMSITMYSKKGFKLNFIDSLNFLNCNLDKLVNDLKSSHHSFPLMKEYFTKQGYNSETIENVQQKGYFPYEYITSCDVLNDEKLPSKECFFSSLKDKEISDSEYSFAQKVFTDANCQNLYDYLLLYLQTDVLLLAEVFQAFRNEMFITHNLDPAQFLSSPAYAIQSALYFSKRGVQLLNDVEIYSLFEKNIRGGFSCANVGYARFNNKDLGAEFDERKGVESGVFLDFNSLYAQVLSGKLPCEDFAELTENEVSSFSIENIDCAGDYTYALLIDYYIPDDVKMKTDDFPLSLHHLEVDDKQMSEFSKKLLRDCNVKLPKCKKLIASHLPQKEYLIALPLLQNHVALGMKVSKIHRIFRFKQCAYFKQYIEKNIDLRKKSSSKAKGNYYKLLNNSIYGKCLFNLRKHSGKISLVMNEKEFEKRISDNGLKECYPISENKMLIKTERSSITLSHPLHVGWYILEMSKLVMYNFFYNVLKKHYGDNVSLIYTDTDSLLIKLRGYSFFDEALCSPLNEYVDRSNFSKDHPLYDDSMAGVLGKLKSEIGQYSIREVVCLQPKCYSVLTNNPISEVKQSAKGVEKSRQYLLTHQRYIDIHKQKEKFYNIKVCRMMKRTNRIFVTEQVKRSLSKLDNKRYWVNAIESVAYGHPSIARAPSFVENVHDGDHVEEKNDNPVRLSKRRMTNVSELGLNLNFKRKKPAVDLYINKIFR